MSIVVGTEFEAALVETCTDAGKSRPRVRALHPEIPDVWRVEFPRDLREQYPIGMRFRCDLRVCQKHNQDGSLRGQPYLFADPSSIQTLTDYTPGSVLRAVRAPHSKSGRVYQYLDPQAANTINLDDLRARIEALQTAPNKIECNTTKFLRSNLVKTFVHLRANGVCESCREVAPFISRNGEPYLEVHHIVALSSGGEDSIRNTAAICPTCHSRITHGVDGAEVNGRLATYVCGLEP
jgi:5-methylcytosine-specific restriction endonuclease McrA